MNPKIISQSTIEQWVEKAQHGHERSFVKLYDLFFEPIFRYVAFRVPADQVEDLVGEIFYKVVKNLSKYEKKKGSRFKSWIYRIAHNQVIDFYRKQKELLGEDGLEEDFFVNLPDEKEDTPEEQILKKEVYEKLYTVMKQLSPSHREILELKFLEEFTNTEIAQITGKSEGSIRLMQLRALREMRKYFKHHPSL